MASIRNFKKDLNSVLSDVIEECYIGQLTADEKNAKKFDDLIDESIDTFDIFIAKINDKKVENRAAHLKAVKKELVENVDKLLEKISKLKA